MVKSFVKNIINQYLIWQSKKISDSFYSNVIRYNPQLREKAVDEEKWLKKWRQYDPKLSPMAYRVFSRYIGPNINIVPLEICSSICEPVLTPHNFMDFYSDKNSLDLIFPQGTLPTVMARNIRGHFMDARYNPIKESQVEVALLESQFDSVIVKPTLSSSGKGVEKFIKSNGALTNKNGQTLKLDYLQKNFKSDYIIQQAFEQHSFFAFFNPSSVNTLRIVSYRDSNGIIQILNSILRIGLAGSVVDNAHAGGMFVGVSKNGVLGKYVCDQYGRTQTVFNNIDFANEEFEVPLWQSIKEKIKELALYVAHHDLIAWDVVVDPEFNPHILELNVGGFSGWLFQFTSGPMFGDYTDDVMDFVTQKAKDSEWKIMFYRK